MWWNIAVDLLQEIDNSEATRSVAYLGVRLALATNDVTNAALSLRDTTDDVLADSSVRRRIEGLSAHIALATATDDATTIERLTPHLVHDHILAREYGGQDYATAVLVSALRAAGDHTQASTLAEQYLTRFRRERSALPPYLAQLAPTGA